MNDNLEKNEKRRILIYLIVSFVIVSLVVVFFIFYNKVFIMEYNDNGVIFNYPSNFKVRKKDNVISVISKDSVAKIGIEVKKNSSSYLSSQYSDISNDVFSKIVDSNFSILSNDCSDHMCSALYESSKDKLRIVVEFREDTLVTYNYRVSKSKFNNYSDAFDTVLNSFTIELDED